MPFDGAFSPIHWLIVGVIALLVLGPDKLPGAARQVARGFRAFTDAREQVTKEVRGLLDVEPAGPPAEAETVEPTPVDDRIPRGAREWPPAGTSRS
jgi:TatA/E family protein of Tat protein translocase